MVRVAVEAPGADALPAQVREPGERPHQHVVSLAGHDRADGEQHRRGVRRRLGGSARRRIGTRLDDPHPAGVHAEAAQSPRGERAGDDDASHDRERAPLPLREAGSDLRREPRLLGHRVVDQGQDPQPAAVRRHRLRQSAESQAVDDDRRAVGHPAQRLRHAGAGGVVRVRERAAQGVDDHPPAAAPQPVRHSRVVQVAAGSLLERAGHDQVQRGSRHSAPS